MKYELNQIVSLETGEQGTIIGRSEYTYCNPMYLLRYVAKDGRLVEAWWAEDALVTT